MKPSPPEKSDQAVPAGPSFLDRPAARGIIKDRLDSMEAMTLSDIEMVAAMHARAISSGILTELGPSFLTLFYRQVVSHRHARGYVVRKEGKVVAFIAGSTDPGAFFNDLFSRYFFQIGLIVVRKSLASPLFLPRFFQRVLANLRKENMAESLAAAVAREYDAAGYGVLLLKKLLDDFRQSGVRRVQCDVAVNKADPAVVTLHKMYQKGGYVESGEFRVGGVTYKRYQRDL